MPNESLADVIPSFKKLFIGKPIKTRYGTGYFLFMKGEFTVVSMGRNVIMYLGPKFVYTDQDLDDISVPQEEHAEAKGSKCLLF